MILVVDDDARVRDAVAGALSALGHQVITACDGKEALNICAHEPDIQLVVTDVMMPRLTGPDFVAQAQIQRPDLRVIYMSGSIGDTPRTALGDHPLLAKPFTAATLTQLVQQTLAT